MTLTTRSCFDRVSFSRHSCHIRREPTVQRRQVLLLGLDLPRRRACGLGEANAQTSQAVLTWSRGGGTPPTDRGPAPVSRDSTCGCCPWHGRTRPVTAQPVSAPAASTGSPSRKRAPSLRASSSVIPAPPT